MKCIEALHRVFEKAATKLDWLRRNNAAQEQDEGDKLPPIHLCQQVLFSLSSLSRSKQVYYLKLKRLIFSGRSKASSIDGVTTRATIF